MGSWLEHFHGPLAYVVCGLLVFGEAAVLLGFVIPGETAALIGGVLASLHHVDLVVMLVVIVVCAIVGDSVGFEVGKLLGPWLLEHRPLRGQAGVHRGQDLLARRGRPGGVPGAMGGAGPRPRARAGGHERHAVPHVPHLQRPGRHRVGDDVRLDRLRGGDVVRGGGQDRRRSTRSGCLAVVVVAVVVLVVVRHRRDRRKWGGGVDDHRRP